MLRWPALLVLPFLLSASDDSGPSGDCAGVLEQAIAARRLGDYREARNGFEGAARDPICRAPASVALAEVWLRLAEPKRAAAAARAALASTDDPGLRSEASYQLGIALFDHKRRIDDGTRAAEQAFRDAIAWSEGMHRGAVRELATLYLETAQEQPLAELRELYPAARVRSLRERLAEASVKPAAPAATASPPAPLEDLPDLPRFVAWNGSTWTSAAEGYDPPVPTTPLALELAAAAALPGEKPSGPGEIVVAGLLSPEGKITTTRVVASLSPEADALARETLAQWQLEPARDEDGQAVAVIVVVTFRIAG
jgi:hypothetical protein